jgi:hypothetical protein
VCRPHSTRPTSDGQVSSRTTYKASWFSSSRIILEYHFWITIIFFTTYHSFISRRRHCTVVNKKTELIKSHFLNIEHRTQRTPRNYHKLKSHGRWKTPVCVVTTNCMYSSRIFKTLGTIQSSVQLAPTKPPTLIFFSDVRRSSPDRKLNERVLKRDVATPEETYCVRKTKRKLNATALQTVETRLT